MSDDEPRNPTNTTLGDATLDELVRELKSRCTGMIVCFERDLPDKPGCTAYRYDALGSMATQMGLSVYLNNKIQDQFMFEDIPDDEEVDDEDEDEQPPHHLGE